MSPTLKRILLILGLLIATILIGLGLYLAFKKAQIPSAPARPTPTGAGGRLPAAGGREAPGDEGQPVPTGGLPAAGVTAPPVTPPGYYQPEPVTKITNDQTLYPSVNTSGNFRYHNAADGKFYEVKDGTATPLADQVFYNVKNVTWAKSKDKAVIEYPDNSKIVYNFETKKQVSLPKHWESFSFSNDGNEIAAKSIGLAPENRWLVTTRDDGTGAKLIEPLGNNEDKVIVDWSPSRQTVAFSKTGDPLGADRREILLIGLNHENFKGLVVEGLDFQPRWSPTGQQLLYSVDSARSNFKPELWIANSYGDAIGNNRQALGINTWANKCAFGGEGTLFCAVPRNLPDGAGMSPAVAADEFDDLYKIDLKTGAKTPVTLDTNYTFDSISYDASKNKVLFTDRHKNGAFQVNL
ncbi:MAG: PD40 domain-containing protein [Candidatus Magasanikbacteria bacterium]|nr:PD40 domain-containing protein [Candidatus Magasanikbacteria bacterium]